MTLLAAASTSMPWAATAPATTMAATNTATPVGLLMLRSSSFEWLSARESASLVTPRGRRHLYRLVRRSGLIVRSGSRLPHLRLLRSRQMRRSKVERHIVDLAVEPKWHLIVLVVDPGARIDPDVEGFVRREQERDRLGDLQSPNLA